MNPSTTYWRQNRAKLLRCKPSNPVLPIHGKKHSKLSILRQFYVNYQQRSGSIGPRDGDAKASSIIKYQRKFVIALLSSIMQLEQAPSAGPLEISALNSARFQQERSGEDHENQRDAAAITVGMPKPFSFFAIISVSNFGTLFETRSAFAIP